MVLCVLCCAGAAAQEREVFDFDDDAVAGEIVRPEGERVGPGPGRPEVRDLDAEIGRLRARLRRRPTGPARLGLARLLAERAARAWARADSGEDGPSGEADARAALSQLARIGGREPPSLRSEALALASWLHDGLGDAAAALDAARGVIAACPRCREAADAHVRIGDHLFLEARMTDAIAHYAQAAGVPAAPPAVRAYAHYKTGWARFNLSDFEAAFRSLEAARREADAASDASGRRLAREARRDQVLVLSAMRVAAAEACARIASLAAEPTERDALADRYRRILADQGRGSDALAFAQACQYPGGGAP